MSSSPFLPTAALLADLDRRQQQQSSQQQQQSSQQQQQSSQQSGTQSGGNSTQTGNSTSSVSIPSTAPAGGLTITQPPQTATSFFKLAPSNPITFGWNFTFLVATPTSLTVSAVGDNGNTYAVGPSDGVIAGGATQVVWDPYAYNQDSAHRTATLAQGSYTLSIWGDGGPSAVQQPGRLSPNSGLKFALYTPQPYTPLASGWQCTVCRNGALSSMSAHPAYVGVLTALLVMFLSGFHLLRR